MHLLITGSTGLIGCAAAEHFLNAGHTVIGVDNDMRQTFFGPEASTSPQLALLKEFNRYQHHAIDIRNTKKLKKLFSEKQLDAIIHTAAQPSHDKASEIPMLDFEVNAQATLHLLELTREHHPKAVFIFTSTNKVYGDNPNNIPLRETSTRYEYADSRIGVDESLSIDTCMHSLFGASKTSADIYVQEYGKYFDLNTTVLRLGCITGTHHAGTKAHGFLSYLVKSLLHQNSYHVIGYGGKQVRDQLDARDVAQAFEHIIASPTKGKVFNLGGGPDNSASILELIGAISDKASITPNITFEKQPRKGDHICYTTDFQAFQTTYPSWQIQYSLDAILDDMISYEQSNT